MRITYFGKEYEVPDWVRYVATQKSSNIYGYSHQPKALIDAGVWVVQAPGEMVNFDFMGTHKINVHWTKTCKKVTE